MVDIGWIAVGAVALALLVAPALVWAMRPRRTPNVTTPQAK